MESADSAAVWLEGVSFSYTIDVERQRILPEPIPALRNFTLALPYGCRCVVVGAEALRSGKEKFIFVRTPASRRLAENHPRDSIERGANRGRFEAGAAAASSSSSETSETSELATRERVGL